MSLPPLTSVTGPNDALLSAPVGVIDRSPPVAVLLRFEALAVLAAGLAAFAYLGVSWWWFAVLVLVPDLSAIGYLGGDRLGAWCYDLVHTYVGPAILGVVGFTIHEPTTMAVAAVWFSHIGFDRLIGYGLKFAGSPKDTHMSRARTRVA